MSQMERQHPTGRPLPDDRSNDWPTGDAVLDLSVEPQAVEHTALINEVFEAGFDFVTGVPDSHLAGFLKALAADERAGECFLPGTREDNCIGLAVGAYLAGATPLVFMKSAGLGTCLDALTSLALVYRIPVVLLVSWAGHDGRDVPHHNVIGQPAPAVLQALGVPALLSRFDDPADTAEQLRAALREAVRVSSPVAVLCAPEGE
ncbi:thiamine pyrophosphate-binding protein [Streptomyces sp. NPDC005955]|uniref:thiamine pyrophosphate-binding protein n=1 Tax=Streptomyces sp. NPDC005955 TaxID=3364738 RepID=UPI0036AB7DDD